MPFPQIFISILSFFVFVFTLKSQLAKGLHVDEIGGGFNGAIPGQADGAFGCGYTVNATNVVFGLGATLGNQSIGVDVVQDKVTGVVKLVVNGKEVAL